MREPAYTGILEISAFRVEQVVIILNSIPMSIGLRKARMMKQTLSFETSAIAFALLALTPAEVREGQPFYERIRSARTLRLLDCELTSSKYIFFPLASAENQLISFVTSGHASLPKE